MVVLIMLLIITQRYELVFTKGPSASAVDYGCYIVWSNSDAARFFFHFFVHLGLIDYLCSSFFKGTQII